MRILTTFVTAAVAAAVLVVLPRATVGGNAASVRSSEARLVARRFLRTINTRQFEATCSMLSRRFYRENHVPSRERCVLGFRIGFTWAPTYRFQIGAAHASGDRVTVETLANGAPGTVVLVREAGEFRVLSVRGD